MDFRDSSQFERKRKSQSRTLEKTYLVTLGSITFGKQQSVEIVGGQKATKKTFQNFKGHRTLGKSWKGIRKSGKGWGGNIDREW